MELIKSSEIVDLASIERLFESLKANRIVLKWSEFAQKIGYNRTYVSRVMNRQEALTDDFVSAVKKALNDGTFGVPQGTLVDAKYLTTIEEMNDLLKKENERLKREHEKEIARLQAELKELKEVKEIVTEIKQSLNSGGQSTTS